MRHSAWTLWLVPLALPLVLLCIPGSMEPLDSQAREDRVTHEFPQTVETVPSELRADVLAQPAPLSEDPSMDPSLRQPG